jgi:hypothetical protein
MDWSGSQHPKYEDSMIVEAYWKDTGQNLTVSELDAINEDSDFVYESLQDFIH